MMVSTTFDELDPVADHLAIGLALGDTGYASSTLALALATHAAVMDAKPVVLASVTDSRARSVAILTPWQADPSPSIHSAPPTQS